MFAAAGALIFGLLQGGVAWAWWSLPSVMVFAVALAAAATAVVAERRAAEPILPPWFWRSRVLTGSAVAAFGLGLWSSARPRSCPPTASRCSAWGPWPWAGTRGR